MARLPNAPWTSRPGLGKLVVALGHENIRWVGGAVRDTLLGEDVRDVDAATPFSPPQVIAACTKAGIRTAPTGIDHGTITAILEDGPVEVTTLRKDVSTDGRRATVEFAQDWRDDAARRDFTINALYADPHTLEIWDYFGGLDDLDAGRVRFIGDARERIREDYLRILRYFRFQARFGSQLDEQAEKACSELAGSLRGLSRERVGWELLALLALPDPADTVLRMRQLGVLQVVLPECTPRELSALRQLIATERESRVEPAAIRRLAALLPAITTIAESVAARLRLSKKERARLACIAERKETDAIDPRALAYRKGKACAVDRLLIAGSTIDPIRDWAIPEFPLKGGEIVSRGVASGPDVARIMQTLEARWIEAGFPDRAAVENLLEIELKNG